MKYIVAPYELLPGWNLTMSNHLLAAYMSPYAWETFEKLMRCPLSAGWCHTGWPDSANIVCLLRYISIFGTLTERANIREKQYTSFSAAGEVKKKFQRIRLFTIPLSGCAPATWSNRSSVETNIFFLFFYTTARLSLQHIWSANGQAQHSRICISNLCVCLRSKMLKFSLFRFHVKWERENTILAS